MRLAEAAGELEHMAREKRLEEPERLVQTLEAEFIPVHRELAQELERELEYSGLDPGTYTQIGVRNG